MRIFLNQRKSKKSKTHCILDKFLKKTNRYNLQISPPPLIIFQLNFFKLLYCHRFLIRMQILNLIRRLEGDENYVERIHHIDTKGGPLSS